MDSSLSEASLEKQLWKTANALRGHMDASDYSNVVLGLMFLKYVSDSFEEEHKKLLNSEYPDDAEDKEAYMAQNIFWLPKDARWKIIEKSAKKPNIGQIIDKAMISIEQSNSSLKGILPKNYASPDLNTSHLGEVIDLISDVNIGTVSSRKKDVLGRVYEYFLKNFALQEGHRGGEFYTPRSVVRTLVNLIEPYKGRVYDPCCGSGGMFIQSHKFIQEHRDNTDNISIYGQESNPRTWKLCKMNLAIRGIDCNLGSHQGDTFLNDLHKGSQFDYILANPPFNQKDWGQEQLKDDPRWKYGIPPKNNANFAWLQHIISKLSANGRAGIVLANGALSSATKSESHIRKGIVDDDKLDAIISLPSKLFYSVSIPASLWIINNNKGNHAGHTLFIDARNLGYMVDRRHRDFHKSDIYTIAHAYHEYCHNFGSYHDKVGFCKSVNIKTIRNNDYILIPGRYVGVKRIDISSDAINKNIKSISSELQKYFVKSDKYQRQIINNLKKSNK